MSALLELFALLELWFGICFCDVLRHGCEAIPGVCFGLQGWDFNSQQFSFIGWCVKARLATFWLSLRATRATTASWSLRAKSLDPATGVMSRTIFLEVLM